MSERTYCLRISLWLFITAASVGLIATAAAQEAKQATCSGKVVDEQGRPVAGAKVSFYRIIYDEVTQEAESQLLSQLTTAADGAVSFTTTLPSEGYHYAYIVAEKKGLALGFADWRMNQNPQHRVEFRLGQAKELAGVVVDENDKPIPDAKVGVWMIAVDEGDDRQTLGRPVAENLLTVATDGAGRFAFTNIPADATVEFIIRKSGRATIKTFLNSGISGEKMTFAPGQKDIKLVLPPEARIEGTVRDKDTSKAVSNVILMVMQGSGRPLWGQETVESKEDGTFNINALAAGNYMLRLVAPINMTAEWVAEPVKAALEAGQARTGVEIELCKGGILEVGITDAQNEQPLEKAGVRIFDERWNQWIDVSSDPNGIARVRLMPGAYKLDGIYLLGYASKNVQEDFTIEDGRTKYIKHQLTSQPRITGVVRDENNKPVSGAKLLLCPAGFEEYISDAEGGFDIRWDPGMRGPRSREMTYWLLTRHQERNLAAVDEGINKGTTTLDVKLEPGVIVTGRIVDPSGKGIQGANLTMFLEGPGWGYPLHRGRWRADENGDFEIGAVPAGHSYSVSAEAEGYGSNRSKFHGDDAVNNRMSLEPLTLAAANLSLSGRIVDAEGNPVAGARIESSVFGDGQPTRRSAVADTAGNFTLEGVCEGDINLRVNAVDDGIRLSASARTSGGAKGITIVAREGYSTIQNLTTRTYEQIIQNGEKVIAGMVVDESGSPVGGVPVGVSCIRMKREDGKFAWRFSSYTDLTATTDKLGRFAIELKEDGWYNLLFSPDRHAAMIVYDIPVGKKDLNVTLSEGGTVTGRLVRMDKDQKIPIPDVEVNIEQPNSAAYTFLGFDRNRTVVTDGEGRFRFEHLRTRIRPHASMSKEQWDYVPRVWEVKYGNTSKTIVFYEGTTIADVELVAGADGGEAQPLLGRPMPGFDGIKIGVGRKASEGKRMLVCFFDMNQRPSRNCIIQLAKRIQQLRQKDLTVIAIQVSRVEDAKLAAWVRASKILFPIGMVQGDEVRARFTWGVKSLPWLILADRYHIVRAEGFALTVLDEELGHLGDK